jgi:hypothetical protein
VLAPDASVLVKGEAIHHHWSCDACAYPFATVIALDPRRPQARPPRQHGAREGDAAELCLL